MEPSKMSKAEVMIDLGAILAKYQRLVEAGFRQTLPDSSILDVAPSGDLGAW
jgi:hypothetical protein